MSCPFLTGAEVRFCRISAAPKIIVTAVSGGFDEKCSTPSYAACETYRRHPHSASDTLCPYLGASPAQYCSAVAERRPIPQNPLPSMCDGRRYQYCWTYRQTLGGAAEVPIVGGIRIPQGLLYAANHLWLDLAEDNWCHAGVDGFLATLLGRVEGVTALDWIGTMCPTAVLRAHGLDWRIQFPSVLENSAGNPHLRAHPECVTADPYGGGWLFAGRVDPSTTPAGLISGEQAIDWMRKELDRIALRLRGRAFKYGLLGRLDRDEALSLFQEFCQ